MKKRNKTRKIICTFIVGLFALPLVWMILTSFKANNEVFSSNWFPTVWHPENYATVWNDATVPLWRVFLNSLTIVIFGVGGQLIISSLAAYAFAKIHFKGRGFIFSMFLLRQFYMGLPNELMDAAKVDGAGHFRIFAQILMPLTKPAMISTTILSFISLWNDYLTALIFLVNKKLYTVAQAIRYWLFDDAKPYHLTMATASIFIIPVIIVFIFCQKYFVEGIAATGVKG